MKKLISNPIIKTFFWIALLLASLKLSADIRQAGYNIIPEPYIILDEHTNVWHGLSIRKSGVPAAWSILEPYITDSKIFGAGGSLNGFNLAVDGKQPTLQNFQKFPKPVVGLYEFDFGRGKTNTPLVQPYLDHPPFGAIILSLFVSKNAKDFADVNNFDLRQSALYLAVLTQALIFVLALYLTKKPLIGFIASTVYGTVPSYVLLSRYALLENVLSPIILLEIIVLLLCKDLLNKDESATFLKIMLFIAGILGGLCALTKLTGWIFIAATVLLLYLWKFRIRQIMFYMVPAFLIGILYFAWGFYLSPKLFTDLLLLQGNRDFIGSINLMVTFFRVSIYNFPLDGWWTGGFIALLIIPGEKKYLPIVILTLAALFSALGLSGANYPWYFIPLIPIMSVATALVLYNLAVKPTFSNILFTFFAFVSSSFYWGYAVFQNKQPFNIYRILLMLFIALAYFWAIYKKSGKYKRIWHIGIVALLILLGFLNRRSMIFILENWGKLPLIYTPGTF